MLVKTKFLFRLPIPLPLSLFLFSFPLPNNPVLQPLGGATQVSVCTGKRNVLQQCRKRCLSPDSGEGAHRGSSPTVEAACSGEAPVNWWSGSGGDEFTGGQLS